MAKYTDHQSYILFRKYIFYPKAIVYLEIGVNGIKVDQDYIL